MPSGGEVRVMLGAKLLKFTGNSPQVRTITGHLHPGSNAVRIGWSNIRQPADLRIARITEEGKAEVLFRYRIDGMLKPASGVVTVAIVRDKAPDEQSDQPPIRLSTLVSKGLLRLTLNGRPLGDYASFEQRDVSSFLREGENTLRITWSKDFGSSLPHGEVRIEQGEAVLVRWVGPRALTLNGSDDVTFLFPPE